MGSDTLGTVPRRKSGLAPEQRARLRRAVRRRDSAAANLDAVITELRDTGVPVEAIAEELGVSKQALWERLNRR
jgi:DNA invertase Pin-like site-specific DNA recombinase